MTDITTLDRQQWSRLRSLFIEPGEVELMTDTSDVEPRRWMTDKYVMLDVTRNPALGGPDELPDGMYRVTASKGPVPLDRHAGRDVVSCLQAFEAGADWWAVHETRWTLRDDRAQLIYVCNPVGFQRVPLAIDRDVFEAFKAAYQDAVYQATPVVGHSIRVLPRVKASGRTLAPAAYIQPVRIPDGRQADGTYCKSENELYAAHAIVNLTMSGKQAP